MDEELARQMTATALKCATLLEQLIPDMKARCTPDEIGTYAKADASVMATIHDEILNPVFAGHPKLVHEIEQNINARGTAL